MPPGGRTLNLNAAQTEEYIQLDLFVFLIFHGHRYRILINELFLTYHQFYNRQ